MSLLTGGLGLCLILAICSVHNWEGRGGLTTPQIGGQSGLDSNTFI